MKHIFSHKMNFIILVLQTYIIVYPILNQIN